MYQERVVVHIISCHDDLAELDCVCVRVRVCEWNGGGLPMVTNPATHHCLVHTHFAVSLRSETNIARVNNKGFSVRGSPVLLRIKLQIRKDVAHILKNIIDFRVLTRVTGV